MSIPLAGARARASDWSSVFPQNTDAWVDYVPTLTQGATTVAKTVTAAKYMKTGRRVDYEVSLSVTGTGVINSQVAVGLPVQASAAAINSSVGSTFLLIDVSVGSWITGVAGPTTGGLTAVMIAGGVVAGSNTIGSTGTSFAAALAAGDVIRIVGSYEAAS